ncbi:helix-turn-helix domain-containing protein [Chitinophaga sp. Cy-1792]|uniref:helix-turn-helix domain-containing protein n=1 Tax=Chitinophaga sp. Cy-1792 TaxID=2608339 RepID=UPI001420B182|nr:helix-turn-helix domain-containing protein [Chitinophaga sp. Cy-1792]NIG57426.1 helix-turn-helix domain-containing protein [Chitinophaga sp. Cy-1792]
MKLPVLGIEKIFDLPYKQEDFKILYHAPINEPVIAHAHKHDFYMLLLIERGSGSHTIDFIEYPVEKNTIFFLAPAQAHQWNISPDARGYQVMFSPAFLAQKGPLWPFFTPSALPLLQLRQEEYQLISEEFTKMTTEAANKEPFASQVLYHRLQTILLLLQRWYNVAHPEISASTEHHIINKFLHLLEEHYFQHSTVQFYADKLLISPSYLNQVCSRESGRTAGEYIRERILLEAKRLLTLTTMDIREIAYTLGFKDSSYFSRFFRKYTGNTPLEFRRKS